MSVQVCTARVLMGLVCKNMKAALRMWLKGSGAQNLLGGKKQSVSIMKVAELSFILLFILEFH